MNCSATIEIHVQPAMIAMRQALWPGRVRPSVRKTAMNSGGPTTPAHRSLLICVILSDRAPLALALTS